MRWIAFLAIPPSAAWGVLYGLLKQDGYEAECRRTVDFGTPAMACSRGLFLIGAALALGLTHLLVGIPLMAWISARLRAGKTDAARVRRRGLIVLAIATPISGAIAVATGATVRDFVAELWLPLSVGAAPALLIVSMRSSKSAERKSAPEV